MHNKVQEAYISSDQNYSSKVYFVFTGWFAWSYATYAATTTAPTTAIAVTGWFANAVKQFLLCCDTDVTTELVVDVTDVTTELVVDVTDEAHEDKALAT